MRESNDSSVDVIRQVLNVTFQVPAGTYQACGNTYNVEAFTHTIDPTKTTPIPLWSANHMPSVTWKSESDKLYTLIVWDAGALFLHALMYNINGSSPDHGKTAWNYRGPKNPRDRDQPYAFLLYEQGSEKEETFVRDILIAIQSQSLNLSPVSLATALSLTGPIGASVLTVRTDPYAIGYMKKNRITNYCPDLLTPKFSALPLSYDVSGVRLMSSVDVTFMSPEISVSSCSRDVRFVSNTRIPNPMADGRISPVYTRLQPHVTLVPTNFFDNFYFLRLDLTLLLLDVTEELSGTPGTSLSLLHWQVVNIREGDVMSGETTQPYKRPLPLAMGAGGGSNSGQRVFMFLLLRQSGSLENVSDLVRFTGRESCPPRMRDRCQFNLTSFVTEHRMTIEGASWFMTSPDAYSRQQAIQQGLQGEAEACRGVVPQPTCTGGSEVTRASSLVVVLGLVSALQLLICPVREA
ncbi:uncharacterized protein C56G2.4-like [Babylonia areolata]|uniref:uncharacterized protein C56G2.4-like n=1 Tax=Babylonia areolata TaxID=304850 RepID=UPI003FCFBC71